MTRDEILAGAVNAWGTRSQVNMAIEECGELIVVLSHRIRGRATDLDVAGEIADVRIMLDQLALIIGKDLVTQAEEAKLDRLEERVRAATPTTFDLKKLAEALSRDASGVYAEGYDGEGGGGDGGDGGGDGDDGREGGGGS